MVTEEGLSQKTEDMYNIISSNVVKFQKEMGFLQLQLALNIGLIGNALSQELKKEPTMLILILSILLRLRLF